MIDRTLILWFLFFVKEDDIETPFGNLHVAIQGDRSKLAILTFHDIGLNSKSMHGNICLLLVTNQKNLSSKFNWLCDNTNANCQILFSVIHHEMKYRILHIRSKFEFAVWYNIEMLLINNFRHHMLPRIFQLYGYAAYLATFLCVPCQCTWAGRWRTPFTTRVRLISSFLGFIFIYFFPII